MRVVPADLVPSSLADPGHFTGRVWRTDYLTPENPDRLAGARFFYEPGARSYWHLHDREQAIIAVYGSGLVAWESLDAPLALAVGDWWHVSAGVPHWHGASPTSAFAHLAVTAGGPTRWLHEVSDEHYLTDATRGPGQG